MSTLINAEDNYEKQVNIFWRQHLLFQTISKAELPQEGILFCTQFSSLGIFIMKKLEIEKTKTTFETDIIEVVLVFLIFNFFTNKNSQGRKLSAV